MERNIQISHLPEIDEIDRSKIDATVLACYDKLAVILHNEVLLRIHFKAHERGGTRKQHSVKMHLSIPGIDFVSNATDWNLITALQEAVTILERKVVKKVK